MQIEDNLLNEIGNIPGSSSSTSGLSDRSSLPARRTEERINRFYDESYERELLSTFALNIPGFKVGNCELWKLKHEEKYAIVIFDSSRGGTDPITDDNLNQLNTLINSQLDRLNIASSLRDQLSTRGLDDIDTLRSHELSPDTASELMKELEPKQQSIEDLRNEIRRLTGATSHRIGFSANHEEPIPHDGDDKRTTKQNPNPSSTGNESDEPKIISIKANPFTTKPPSGEIKATSILGKEIETYEDYTTVIYGLDIALGKIEHAGKVFLDTLETSLRTHPDLVKLIEDTIPGGEITKITLKVADISKLKGADKKFFAAQVKMDLEKDLRELAKAIDFYKVISSKLGERIEFHQKSSDPAYKLRYFVDDDGKTFKFSDGVFNLFGDLREATRTRTEDYITTQLAAKKIMPYSIQVRKSLARFIHYNCTFPRELTYITEGLDLIRVRKGIAKITNPKDLDSKSVLVDFIPRLKRYFIEKISAPENEQDNMDLSDYLKTDLEMLCVPLKSTLKNTDFETIDDEIKRELLRGAKEQQTPIYKWLEKEYCEFKAPHLKLETF